MVGGGTNGSEISRKEMIEGGVGGLVWVRRRNGSWWPGQIVGLDELSSENGDGGGGGVGSHSPRSGTPIKLLGRDDSSVDWFDLETTKGVKAFRCGDYDSCIEKAKASAATSSKRSAKYPKRENAIICALEIEKSCLLKDCPDLHSPSNNPKAEPPLSHANGSPAISHPSRNNDCSSEETSSAESTSTCGDNSNSTQELSHSGISYEETNGSTYLKGQQLKGRRRKTPNDSEDDGSEGIKRMKGLDDLGLGSDKKVQVLALPNPVSQSSASLNNFRTANGTSLGNVTNGASIPTLKRKRSQVVHIQELLKRKYRRRPLTKVLENTTMVPVRIICDEFATPFERSDTISRSDAFENGNKVKDAHLRNGQLPEDYSSDMLFDVPFVDDDLHPSGFSPVRHTSSHLRPHSFRGSSSRNFQVETSSFGHEEFNEFGFVHPTAARVNQKIEKSASKWQSKGKRKARHINKTEDPYSRKKVDEDHKSDAYTLALESPGRFSPNSNGLINGFTDWRKPISLTSSPRSFSYHHQPRFLVHTGYEMPDVSPRTRGIYADSSLYEIEITVEATRPQAQHVPYISLMSKLNGKPITGHPVAVEVLEDGFCDLQVCDYPASGSCELDDEDTEMGFPVDPKARPTKHILLRPHLPRKKKSSRKSKKSKKSKRHGSSSKKTRKLSSLTAPHKLNLEKRNPMEQNPKGPTLACVPLKIVFSRINEALNGSTRSAHRAATSNHT